MDTPSAEVPRGPDEGRLDSWKKIAVHLKRDVTTVQRWEKREGMPVHRHLHDKTGSVYAYRTELDAWARSRRGPQSRDGAQAAPSDGAPWDSRDAHWFAHVRPTAGLIAATITVIVVAAIIWIERGSYFWRDPIAGAVYQSLTGFDSDNEAAAVSRDGQFVAFLSDRGGRTDVWVTQVGSGEFHNLTRGLDGELINPSVRELSFSPDGSLVMFWVRTRSSRPAASISIWAVPTLGGEPRPYLAGVAEAAWSPDGNRIAYHTPGPGDPLFVSDGKGLARSGPILVAPPGLHMHFQVWGPGNRIYFVKGSLPDQLDVWRTDLRGGHLQRITSQSTRVTYPVLLDRRTMLYLASAPDGSGPWIYGIDVERRVPHRLTTGVEQYTSLAASADGHRVIATVSEPQRTLWRVGITEPSADASPPVPITLATGSGFAPRLGPNYLLYVAASGTGDGIWKISGAAATQLWAGNDARIVSSPAVSADGRMIAFAVAQGGHTLLYRMESDGSGVRIVADSLRLQGAPTWAPDGRSITSAAENNGVPRLYRIPLDGSPPAPLVRAYSVDPTWSPDGTFVLYSGPDVGTTFTVRAISAENAVRSLPPLTLTRGARHLVLLADGRKMVFLQGGIQHKDLWMVDLQTGSMRQITHIPADFDVRDFDVSPDGREAILERAQTRSSVVAIDRPSS